MRKADLPAWNDSELNMGSMVRAALWLVTVVGEGNVFTKRDLREAFPGVAQIDRRMRDLREYGWSIATNRDDALLGANECRFVKAGHPVWEPGVRRAARVPERANVDVLPTLRPLERIVQAPDPDSVWERLQSLSPTERSLIMAWMAMDRRPSSPVDLAWRAYRSLSDQQRQRMTVRLAELISSEISAELPAPQGDSDER
ncbi:MULTISPECIES: hypothetical protein [Streptomyces]|uniref:hypothetical protein n=1 Tax=Streptomyces TaxID=1883 RepID=UPI0036923FF5